MKPGSQAPTPSKGSSYKLVDRTNNKSGRPR